VSVLLGTVFAPLFGQSFDWASVGIYAFLGLGPLAFIAPFRLALRIGEITE